MRSHALLQRIPASCVQDSYDLLQSICIYNLWINTKEWLIGLIYAAIYLRSENVTLKFSYLTYNRCPFRRWRQGYKMRIHKFSYVRNSMAFLYFELTAFCEVPCIRRRRKKQLTNITCIGSNAEGLKFTITILLPVQSTSLANSKKTSSDSS